MNESSEGAEDATGVRRANGDPRRNHDWHPGSVRVLSSAVVKGVTTPNDRRPIPHASNAETRLPGAKAEVERSETEVVEVGGSGGYGRTGTCGGRPPAAGKRDCGTVRFAVGADGCGAMGCRVESPVYEAEKETGETRVLCLGHVREWLER